MLTCYLSRTWYFVAHTFGVDAAAVSPSCISSANVFSSSLFCRQAMWVLQDTGDKARVEKNAPLQNGCQTIAGELYRFKQPHSSWDHIFGEIKKESCGYLSLLWIYLPAVLTINLSIHIILKSSSSLMKMPLNCIFFFPFFSFFSEPNKVVKYPDKAKGTFTVRYALACISANNREGWQHLADAGFCIAREENYPKGFQ